jgi:ABC-type lipoprotein export system ATPase subunit
MKLRIERVSVIYDKGEPNETIGLPSVSLTLEAGHPVVLSGPNGCGKTTLLKVLAGFLRPAEGTVYIVRENDSFPVAPGWLRSNSAYLRQQPLGGLFPDLTLAENLALFLPDSRYFDPYLRSAEFHKGEESVGKVVSFYTSHREHRLTDLSGGQQQLFAVACAEASDRKMLLFDEPTSALDPKATAQTESLLRALCNEHDKISLIVSHDATLASRLGFGSQSFHEISTF